MFNFFIQFGGKIIVNDLLSGFDVDSNSAI
jgi:hypothetical protein